MSAHKRPRRRKSPTHPVAEALEVRVLLSGSPADGVFTGWPDFGTGAGDPAGTAFVADINTDGRPDILMTGTGNNLALLPGAGDGTFLPAVSVALGCTLETLAVGDVNGDGHPDVVAATFNTYEQLTIVLGHGDATFDAPQSTTLSLFQYFGLTPWPTSTATGTRTSWPG